MIGEEIMNDLDNVDFLSLPIEELGEYLVQNEVEDSWKHLSLEYTKEEDDALIIANETKDRNELNLLFNCEPDMNALESELEKLSYERENSFPSNGSIVQETTCASKDGVILHGSKIHQSAAGICTDQNADSNNCFHHQPSTKQYHRSQAGTCTLLPKAPKRCINRTDFRKRQLIFIHNFL